MKITGIYKIQSIIKPERIYIGSAISIESRWGVHLCELRKNKHHSSKLQNHFNKYGEADLQFSIILGCDKEYLIVNEQFFLDSYKPYFNICLHAGNTTGRKTSEETKEKIRIKRKNQIMQPPSEETREKLRNYNRNRVFKQEWKDKISKANKGKKRTEEFKKRSSITHMGNTNKLGFKHNEEFSKKLSAAFKGKPKSEAHKKNMSLAQKRRYGHVC